MKYTAPPYMNDVLPYAPAKAPWLHASRWRYVEAAFRDLCRRYDYREIRTPILEHTELFARSIGEGTDIVSKEMFTFTDRGGRSLTMKPEGTAPVVRACVEHGLLGSYPLLKLYYVGPGFRYERGQRGRYRQHQQLGVEVFGSADPAVDAEVIILALSFFRELGITEMELRVNSLGTPASRAAYLAALRDYARPRLTEFSEEGRERFERNTLRMLDTKDARDLELLESAPRLVDHLDADGRAHFDAVQRYLCALDVEFVVDPRLVRGFDYYTHTTFEIVSRKLGAQDALGGGGRYDGLVEECGGPPTPGIGFGLGMERCLLALDALGVELPVEDEALLAFVVTIGDTQPVRSAAVALVSKLRAAGIPADMDYQAHKLKGQMKRADDLGARFTVILGEDELGRNVVGLRRQATKDQRDVPMHEVVAALRAG